MQLKARTISPDFWMDEFVMSCEPSARLLLLGIWALADREGRLEDKPRLIKGLVLPFDDDIDINDLLRQLLKHRLITRYEIDGQQLIWCNDFHKWQKKLRNQVPSVLPPPPGQVNFYNNAPITSAQRRRILLRDQMKCVICGSIRKLHVDHIQAVTKGGTSDDSNLRTLCKRCNISKGNKDDISEKRRQDIAAGRL